MAREKDPEQLLAQALKAQASSSTGPPATPGFGLLSGADLGMAARLETLAEEQVPYFEPAPETLERQRLHGGAVLLLALLLGLACGAVAGLLTVF